MTKKLETSCCIVGGGPAGMMVGFLLARAGIDVIVLEKHADFFRDFRGDTVHPSTLELMHELRLLESFLQLPHQQVKQLGAQVADDFFTMADFSSVDAVCKFIAFMPQWDFLNFLADKAKKYSSFSLQMGTTAVGLIEENGAIVGVNAVDDRGDCHIRSQLVIGADGRGSIIREAAGLSIQDIGAPMDVLWFKLSRKENDPPQSLGRIRAGVIFIMLNRGEYWQCGYVIPKGHFACMQAESLDQFRQNIVQSAPVLEDRVRELSDWSDVKLLTVKVDRLVRWHRQGLLCIGDAAHAMSPIGGVGINLAVQDAVAAANILWQPLSQNRLSDADLARVQKRRSYPTRMTQALQVFLQENIISRALNQQGTIKPPWFMDVFRLIPAFRAIPANLIGMGFRPEHIHSPEANRER